MTRAFSYIRFSTPGQATGDSFRRQTELSEKYCEKHSLQLQALSFKDLGVSAFRSTNVVEGRLGDFINAIETGLVRAGDFLLVESLDRLSRAEITTALQLFISILNKGVTIVTLQDERTYTKQSVNDIGNLMYSLLIMSRAHEESLIKSLRVTAAWDKKRELARAEGKIMTRQLPGWLKVTNEKIAVDETRVAIVRRIFNDYLNGMGFDMICRTLNQEKIKSFGSNSGKTGWYKGYLKNVIKNRAVLGEHYSPKHEPILNYFPRIIDDETFEKAQKLLSERKKFNGSNSACFINIFAGLLKCGNCGGSIVRVGSTSKDQWFYLTCNDVRRGLTKHEGKSWYLKELEPAILTQIREIDFDYVFNNSSELNDLRGKLTVIEAKREKNIQNRDKLVELLLSSNSTTLLVKLESLELEFEEIKIEIQKISDQIQSSDLGVSHQKIALDDLKDEKNRLKLREQIRALVQRIEVFLPSRRFVIHYRTGKEVHRFKFGVFTKTPA
jgi:DNA invertase Pin-like site-specific DNA recombinase